MLSFTTKADNLRELSPLLHSAKILPQVACTVGEYRKNPELPLHRLEQAGLLESTLIVRSSARNEDTEESSNAGKFLSIPDVSGEDAIFRAVERVAEAMGTEPGNQIFIQPYLEQVELCGVAFTLDPNTGSNSIILNYDDSTGSTSSVTDGSGANLKTFCYFKRSPVAPPVPLDRIIALCRELEELYGRPDLDLEFAISDGELYLLQVRPLVLRCPIADLDEQTKMLNLICSKIHRSMLPHPDLFGEQTIYGVMPDWNPAEMIGIRPRPLALSLYKEIITNGVWAYQRDNYGYRNLRSFPLMVDFCGMPYIDTRVSFNSFLPKQLSDSLAQKLADYYIARLRENPEKHDKVEFEIAFTCYTFDLPKRIHILTQYGFSQKECNELLEALRALTNSIICKDGGGWQKDAEKISILKEKHQEIMDSGMGAAEKIYWLLEYCKRYGTLPFAGLARAGFIAVEFLRSMVSEGVLSEEEHMHYMAGISTIGKMISNDFAQLSQSAFLQKYGHLRPGTYDICSPRYDQSGTEYFDFSGQHTVKIEEEPFKLSLKQLSFLQHMLEEHRLSADVLSLFEFIRQAIEGREYAKFIFTRVLSDVLELLSALGTEYGLSREEMSYISIQRVLEAYSGSGDMEQILRDSIAQGRALEQVSTSIILPPLIWSEEQVYAFFQPDGEPNFITQKQCTAETVCLPSEENLKGKIVLIRSADPGYDWLFSRGIAGFITAYGGVNSHMAIRSAEFGLPAVIGVGEKAFERYCSAKRLCIDCRNRTVMDLT